MLQKLSEQIRACYECAAEDKKKAGAVVAPDLKADFLDLETRWLALAGSYAFADLTKCRVTATESRFSK
jgi:hypothetical protein